MFKPAKMNPNFNICMAPMFTAPELDAGGARGANLKIWVYFARLAPRHKVHVLSRFPAAPRRAGHTVRLASVWGPLRCAPRGAASPGTKNGRGGGGLARAPRRNVEK